MTRPDQPQPTRSFRADHVTAEIYATRDEMGRAAARHVAGELVALQKDQEEVRIVVGSAPSQDEFFRHLVDPSVSGRVAWDRVVAFHMDEYVGMPAEAEQSFRRYQREHFVSKVGLKAFHEIRGEAADPAAECERLARLLAAAPIDLVCLGIGENGHLAFNDPPLARFDDREWARVVALEERCRQQQVNDGCFPHLEAVPKQAITLTLRVFREAGQLSGVVPARTKAEAVASTLVGRVTDACPSTLLRIHPKARLFLDRDSAHLLPES